MIQKDLIYIVSAGLCNLIPFDPAWRVFCLCSRSCNKTAKFRNTNKINVFKVTNLKNVWTRDINTHTTLLAEMFKKINFFSFVKKANWEKYKNHDRQTDRRTAGCWRDSNNFYLVKLYHIYTHTHTHTNSPCICTAWEKLGQPLRHTYTLDGERERGGKGKNIGKCLGKKKTHTQERELFKDGGRWKLTTKSLDWSKPNLHQLFFVPRYNAQSI